jgi:hypothetical protein
MISTVWKVPLSMVHGASAASIQPLAKIDDSLTTRGNPVQTREKRREYVDVIHYAGA